MRYEQLVPGKLHGGRSSRRGGRSVALIVAVLGVSLAGTARGQAITEFSIPTATSGPYGIAAGPDGNLWFTEGFGNQIGRITTAGAITVGHWHPVPHYRTRTRTQQARDTGAANMPEVP